MPPTTPPSGNGWTVIATLIHRPGRSTLVRRLDPGIDLDAEAWSRSDGWCEHCRVRRPRRITLLVRHVNGQLAQVGSTCLHDLLGRADDSGPLLGPSRPGSDPTPPCDLTPPASD
ncbi:MAG: hypothetical protein ACRDMJ_06155, partial [Solirubrobacteraceae bacterium]